MINGKIPKYPTLFTFVSHSYKTTMKNDHKTTEAQSMYSPGAGPWLDDYVDVFAAAWKMPVVDLPKNVV